MNPNLCAIISPPREKCGLAGWQAAGDTLGTLRDTCASLDQAALPTRSVVWDEVPGRSGVLAVQGAA